MRVRLPLAAAATTFAFAVGLLLSRALVRDAHAQASPFSATVYVPSDGIAFRAFDGRIVARLSYDAHGGVFDLYDEREQPVTRLRGESVARPAVPVNPPPFARPKEQDFGF